MFMSSLPLVFLERGISMCLCPLSQCFRYNSLRTNRQRWTVGSVVTNEMRFSDRQHPRFGSCRLTNVYSSF